MSARAVALTVLAALGAAACTTTPGRDELAAEYYNIGSAYFELERYDQAATFLARAIELESDLARASYNLARVYVEQSRHDLAIELLNELLARDPANVIVLETLGYAHYQAGDATEAALWYDRALEVSPTDADLLRNRALVALAQDDADAAVAALERALELTPQEPDLLARLASAHEAAGDAVAALDVYRDYVAIASPPRPDAVFAYASLLEEAEFYADALEALALITTASAAPPADQSRAHFARARILLTRAGEVETGTEALRNALSLGFADAEAAASLVADPGLVARDDVVEMLESAGLLERADDGTASETDATDPSSDGADTDDGTPDADEPGAGGSGATDPVDTDQDPGAGESERSDDDDEPSDDDRGAGPGGAGPGTGA